jgi:hypothetical protein
MGVFEIQKRLCTEMRNCSFYSFRFGINNPYVKNSVCKANRTESQTNQWNGKPSRPYNSVARQISWFVEGLVGPSKRDEIILVVTHSKCLSAFSKLRGRYRDGKTKRGKTPKVREPQCWHIMAQHTIYKYSVSITKWTHHFSIINTQLNIGRAMCKTWNFHG